MSIFSQVKVNRPQSNTFDLSHDRKMSLNMGELVPVLAIETIPGDYFNMSTSQMLRFAPLIAPVMHKISVYTHFFFVPNRVLWENWQDFITGGEDGLDASVFPYLNFDGSQALGSLQDYMGLPVGTTNELIQISAMPFAAYQFIYNEYYRDQNLISPAEYKLVDGDNSSSSIIQLKKRAWQHDYFTAALPWTQKGVEATIPLGNVEDVTFVNGDDIRITPATPTIGVTGDPKIGFLQAASQTTGAPSPLELAVGSTTINELRNAFRLQEWLEKNARGGSRYTESILSHFGVKSSDARLQRPEFLGGSSTPVTISEVLQTSSTSAEPTPQANMAGHGISVGSNRNISYRCEEHGYIIGIMSVMPKTAYQQGIPKHFMKFDKFDYFWPSFAHLGEQPIVNKEIYYANDGENEDTFGYTPRYAEYKYLNSSVHGEFKDTLDFWQYGRIFGSRPYLNKTFIECVPDNRIFAVTDAEKLYCHVYNNIKAKRLMPYFGTPKF